MLSFPSQNDNFIFPTGRCSRKTDPGDGKPTYFYVWPNLSVYYLEIF